MKRLLPLILCLLFPCATPRLQAGALPVTSVSGRIIAFDEDTSLLAVNTRLGRRSFLITNTTLILLNNHAGDTGDLQPGDEANVTFQYHNSAATRVRVFRETRQRGTVTAVGNNTIDLRLRGGAVIQLRPDAQSRIELEQIPVEDRRVLIGRRVVSVFEPGTFLLLSLAGESGSAAGPITAVDAATRTVTLGGRRPRVYTLDAPATVRRGGEVVPLTALTVGDRARVAFVREGTTFRGLALDARSQ
jgi:hypothetical protein